MLSKRIEFAITLVKEFSGISMFNPMLSVHIKQLAGTKSSDVSPVSGHVWEVKINANDVSTPSPVIRCNKPRKSNVSSLL